MKIAIAQLAPKFLDRVATTGQVVEATRRAASEGARLVAFGEGFVPAYPLWVCRTDGARFEAEDQKELFAHYSREAVCLERGDLSSVQEVARANEITVVLGIIERPLDRGGHSLYCTAVVIDASGKIASRHRKLMPTYEERLVWSIGDGAGLVTHPVGPFTVGALNCWENWMPLARAALYAAGEDLHVMLWPGCRRLTEDITRFVAKESRSYVLSASALIRPSDLSSELRQQIGTNEEIYYDGGSAIAGPDGQWILEPVVGREELLFAELDPDRVREERQSFDPSGHYARADVLHLTVDRRPQSAVEWIDPK